MPEDKDNHDERGFRNARGRQRPDVRRDSGRRRSAARPSDRRRSADPARRAAWQVCRKVDEGAYANLELPKVLRTDGVRGRDAAFATELTYGAIRMRGLYDPMIELAAGRPTHRIDAPILDTLRLGAHQLFGMRVPAHAAASETVGLARDVNGAGAAGLVNAVLRRLSERTREEWLAEVTAGLDPVDALAIEHSHPAWIVRALRGALLASGAASRETIGTELARLLEADNAAPHVSLVARPGLCTVDELVDAGATRSRLSPVGAVLPSGDPGGIRAVRETRAAVQDEGSQLLALALAEASMPAGRSEEWLDLCAGPGGKAALLATLAAQQDAVLFANEVSEHRTRLVRKTLAAALDAGIEVMVGSGDGRELGREEPDTYDRVLVDAPCTGLGALRRRPEARWRRTAADVPALATLQRDLLTSAIDAARPGGLVGYATCSPHVAETTQVVDEVLEGRTDVVREDARPLFRDSSGEQIADLGEGPTVQLWPHLHQTDAMFFALLRKQS